MDDNYPPYVFRGGDGRLQGILVDRWRLWEEKTGIRAELHAMDWGEAQRRMQAGEFDVIDTIFRNEPRERIYEFSKPYVKLEVPVFFRKDISGITDVSSLKGFPVAVKNGDAAVDFLSGNGVYRLVGYDSYEEIVRAAGDRKVGVFVVDKPPAMYFLYKMGIQDRFRMTKPLYSGEFHRAVLKGNGALLAEVEEGFARISPEELGEIDREWLGSAAAPGISWKILVVAALVGFVPILALAGWNRALRKSVERKTAELKKEMEVTSAQAEKLRVSEENYRLVFENAADGILIVQDGRILFVNPDASRFLGVPQDRLAGIPFQEMIHPEDRDRVVEYHDRRMRGEDAPILYVCRVRSASGEYRWIQNKVVFTTWEGKRASLAFMRDITGLKNLEDQLVQSRKMEAVGRLAGGIAHDFNNLLSVILGYSHILLNRPGGEASSAKEINEIRKAAERAAKLTRQLLAFSRKQLLQPKVVCLNDIVSGMTGSLRRLIDGDIELDSRLQEDLPPVLVDPGQVEQVIMDLAANARDAMPHGGRLVVGTRKADVPGPFAGETPAPPRGGYVELFVSDTGTGIEKGILPKIFEPFFTTKGVGKGTGLGLSTVEGIVIQSRGHVAVESEPGRGTTFRIFLPEAGAGPEEPEDPPSGEAAGR
jgi:PAS domain S-box-containing protein